MKIKSYMGVVCALAALAVCAFSSPKSYECDQSAKGTVVKTTLVTEEVIKLDRVKINASLSLTLKPQALESKLQWMRGLKVAGQYPLNIESISQSVTSTGMVDVRAMLSGNIPLSMLSQVYDLQKMNQTSGQAFEVLSIEPYFPIERQQKLHESLSIRLYQMADGFAKQLSKASAQSFRIKRLKVGASPSPQFKSARMVNMVAGVGPNMGQNLVMTKHIQVSAELTLQAKSNSVLFKKNGPN